MLRTGSLQVTEKVPDLWRRTTAEAMGTAFLLAAVVGSVPATTVAM